MPIIRVDDKGKNISKRKVRVSAGLILAGMVGSSYLFFSYDPMVGVFCGIWTNALVGVLNLLD